jgi:L-ascorbate metabolism protein UlaG (beta-lactamase superfamily)
MTMGELGFGFTWYGHSCTEIETESGRRILFDPWFSNPKSTKSAEEVDRCDLLLLTHGHFDHLDVGDTLGIASRLRPAWPCIHELSLWAGRRLPGGMDQVTGMNKGGTFDAGGLGVTLVHADHSAGDVLGDPAASSPAYVGEPVGIVLELESGRRVYFAGDTDVFGDMRLIADLHRPDVAFLPIGGHFTMGPRGAAMAVELLGVKTVIPIHYGTFPILAGTPDQLRLELAARGLGSVQVLAPDPGVRTD